MAKSIYRTRHHYWPILLGYYLSHFIAIGLIFMQIYFMNNLLDDQFWTQGFSIFETFLESPVTRSDSLSLLFPYTIKVNHNHNKDALEQSFDEYYFIL